MEPGCASLATAISVSVIPPLIWTIKPVDVVVTPVTFDEAETMVPFSSILPYAYAGCIWFGPIVILPPLALRYSVAVWPLLRAMISF